MAFELDIGCDHACCEGAPCATCQELFARYGYTTLELSGSAGPISMLSGTPPGTATTWPGFTDGTLAIPSTNSGPCDDQIIRQVSGVGDYYFNASDPVKLWNGTFDYARLSASVFYECEALTPGRGIGIIVEYEVTGDVSAQFSESSFPDWTWDSHVLNGRRATKTFPDGSVAVWLRELAFAGRTLISGSITHVEPNLNAGNPVITSLTLPAFPYDYMGIMIGTVTIS